MPSQFFRIAMTMDGFSPSLSKIQCIPQQLLYSDGKAHRKVSASLLHLAAAADAWGKSWCSFTVTGAATRPLLASVRLTVRWIGSGTCIVEVGTNEEHFLDERQVGQAIKDDEMPSKSRTKTLQIRRHSSACQLSIVCGRVVGTRKLRVKNVY